MLTKHFYKLSVVTLLTILYFTSADYFYHRKAFKNKQILNVRILKKECKRKGANYIDIEYKGIKQFVEVLDGTCEELNVGQKINVLYSSLNNKYYWNKQPTTRIFYLYPVIIGLIIYCIFLDVRKKSRKANLPG